MISAPHLVSTSNRICNFSDEEINDNTLGLSETDIRKKKTVKVWYSKTNTERTSKEGCSQDLNLAKFIELSSPQFQSSLNFLKSIVT